jgi:phage gp36-like protein
MIVTVEDLAKTELYPEIIDEIVRENLEDAKEFILDAEDIARGYLSKFDLEKIFSDATIRTDGGLKKVIKSIASWYLVKKANPNVNIELFRVDYEDAIKWLQAVQAGNLNPDLPYKEDDPDTPDDESNRDVYWKSNIKRTNFF